MVVVTGGFVVVESSVVVLLRVVCRAGTTVVVLVGVSLFPALCCGSERSLLPVHAATINAPVVTATTTNGPSDELPPRRARPNSIF